MGKQKPKKGQPRTLAHVRQGSGDRQPKTVVGTPRADGYPSFSFRYADRSYSGMWEWPPTGEDLDEVLDFLCEMSRLTWLEIKSQLTGSGRRGSRHKKHHYQDSDGVCLEAQRRFGELGLDAVFDQYFRFRLGGEKRLWGFLTDDGVFHVLWWDPDHKVCPSEKRHT